MDNDFFYQCFESPIGKLLLKADSENLLSCRFIEDSFSTNNKQKSNSNIINLAIKELKEYFQSKSKEFITPCKLIGTAFQKQIWSELKNIPYGETISYQYLALRTGHDRAYRAAGNANGLNNFVIFFPCHRVIKSNGTLGGYSAGVSKKIWLLEHEKYFSN